MKKLLTTLSVLIIVTTRENLNHILINPIKTKNILNNSSIIKIWWKR